MINLRIEFEHQLCKNPPLNSICIIVNALPLKINSNELRGENKKISKIIIIMIINGKNHDIALQWLQYSALEEMQLTLNRQDEMLVSISNIS